MLEDGELHIKADDARAGATPHMTRYILSISLVAVIVLFTIIVALWAQG